MGKGNTTTDQEKKTSSKMCILVTSTDMSSSRDLLLPWDVLFDRRYTAKNYWLSKIYTQNIIVHWLQVVPEVTLCAWTHTVFIIVCLVTNIWNCSPATTWFLKYRHILHWCRHMEQWSVIYDHHLRQLLPSSSSTTPTSTSIYNYIGHYISAVGLDSITLRAVLILL